MCVSKAERVPWTSLGNEIAAKMQGGVGVGEPQVRLRRAEKGRHKTIGLYSKCDRKPLEHL